MAVPKEFIRIVSDQSNEICEKDKKKTIGPDHVIEALKVRTIIARIAMPQSLIFDSP